MNPKLPSGDVLHDLLSNQKLTLSEVGRRYGVTRQAVHKVHKNWAEARNIEWRRRPNYNTRREY